MRSLVQRSAPYFSLGNNIREQGAGHLHSFWNFFQKIFLMISSLSQGESQRLSWFLCFEFTSRRPTSVETVLSTNSSSSEFRNMTGMTYDRLVVVPVWLELRLCNAWLRSYFRAVRFSYTVCWICLSWILRKMLENTRNVFADHLRFPADHRLLTAALIYGNFSRGSKSGRACPSVRKSTVYRETRCRVSLYRTHQGPKKSLKLRFYSR